MQELTSSTDSKETNINKKGPSKMAERVALIRFRESRKPENERICYDPYAIHFITPKLWEFALHNPDEYKAKMENIESLFPGLANSVIARVRYFDDVVRASVGSGLEQLVILGAGYDTRAYRIEEVKNIRVFEVDHPDTQRVKAEKIKEIFGSLPDHVVYVQVDLEFDKLGKRLVESGYNISGKTLFIMEGLVMYLQPEATDEMLSFIVHNSGKGSAIIFDYDTLRSADAEDITSEESKNIRSYTKQYGEAIKFGIKEGTIKTFLLERGFSQIRNMSSEDYKKEYFYGKNESRVVSSLVSFAYAVIE